MEPFQKKEKKMNYKLSNQAIGAVMMALQKSLLEQEDIVPVLQGFEIQIDDANHLVVMNPPVVKVCEPDSVDVAMNETDESSVKNVDLWDNR